MIPGVTESDEAWTPALAGEWHGDLIVARRVRIACVAGGRHRSPNEWRTDGCLFHEALHHAAAGFRHDQRHLVHPRADNFGGRGVGRPGLGGQGVLASVQAVELVGAGRVR